MRPRSAIRVPSGPGVGQQGERYDGHVVAAGELDADRVELVRAERSPPRRFGEHDQRDAALQTVAAFDEHRLEVLAGVRLADRDGVAGSHHVLEHGEFQEALLDDERRLVDRLRDARQHAGFECAHVIAGDHAGPVDSLQVLDAGEFARDADGLQGAQHVEAADAPLVAGVAAAFGELGGAPDDPGELGVEHGRGECAGEPGRPGRAACDRRRQALARAWRRAHSVPASAGVTADCGGKFSSECDMSGGFPGGSGTLPEDTPSTPISREQAVRPRTRSRGPA